MVYIKKDEITKTVKNLGRGKSIVIGRPQTVIRVYVQKSSIKSRYGKKRTLTVITEDLDGVFETIRRALEEKYGEKNRT